MTDTHFTPGPWRVITDESAAQVTGFPCIESDGYTVVGVEGMYGDIDTDFANARLIAAAPDMLEALRGVVSEYDNPDNGRTLRWAVDDARDAITKATGASHD